MIYIFVHLLNNKVFYSSLMHGTNMKIVRNQVSNLYKILRKITVLYVLIFTLLDTRWEYSELIDKYSPKLIYGLFVKKNLFSKYVSPSVIWTIWVDW